jgi:FkbM family methyltransferase
VSLLASGEDAWIAKHFPRDFAGYACEVGAYDGLEGSITLALEQAGWKCLAIEPNPALEPGLKLWRDLYRLCACSDHESPAEPFHIYNPGPGGFSTLRRQKPHPNWVPPKDDWSVIQVPVRTLDSLLEEVGFPELHALSIDTEGTELDVLRGFDILRWKPRCVVIESWAVDSPVCTWMAERGYARIDRWNVNDLFLPREYAGAYLQPSAGADLSAAR